MILNFAYKVLLMRFLLRNDRIIYLLAAVVSLLLSYIGSLRATVINPDGVCYIQSAAAIGTIGLHAGVNICGQAQWPLYSTLIFGVASLTKLSYETAAFAIDAFFSLISVVTFIAIIRLLGGSRRVLWLAAGVILLAHEFNSVREYVIRDHGFWAFYLLSIACLLSYFRTFRWCDALLWSVTLVAAILFRIEGVVFLLFMPFVVWFYHEKTLRQRSFSFLQLNTVTAIAGVVLIGWVLFAGHSVSQLGRLTEISYQFTHGIDTLLQSFNVASKGLADHVLSEYSAHDANFVLFLLLVVWYCVSVISNLSVIYAFLVLYAIWHQLRVVSKPATLVVYGYVVVNVLITSIFLVDHLFLAKRYLIALSLVLMLWVPFALEHLIAQRKKQKWLLLLVVFLIFVNSLGGIFDFGYSKKYIHAAGLWLAENAPPNAVIYSNDELVLYYSKHFDTNLFAKYSAFSDKTALTQDKWKQYDYIALRSSKNEHKNEPLIEIKLPPVQVFQNKRGDQVVIYKVQH